MGPLVAVITSGLLGGVWNSATSMPTAIQFPSTLALTAINPVTSRLSAAAPTNLSWKKCEMAQTSWAGTRTTNQCLAAKLCLIRIEPRCIVGQLGSDGQCVRVMSWLRLNDEREMI